MTINEHLSTFHGRPVVEFGGEASTADVDPGAVAWRLRIEPYESEETFPELWERFLADVDTTKVDALVIGCWGESYEVHGDVVVDLLVGAKDRLPALRGIFLGDWVMEEAEVSWIHQADVTPLLTEFPELTELAVRGGEGLELTPVTHRALETLRFEAGGLPAAVVRAVGELDLPALRHLELWLGDPEYGGDATIEDLAGILGGERLPALTHLGLQNSEIQDQVAEAAASAPVTARLTSLSLAMGVLTDDGAEALLTGRPLGHLNKLDLHHHFLSDDMVARVRSVLEPAGVAVNLDEQLTPDTYEGDDKQYMYVAVAE
ncbi:leucine-rich repeat domain-containing protein [Solihabitans fulvus]|uniref:Leucine-rich repeat domain-containing protein n=1 Tax=Solihabitans fulvus TaxID=1892852 RepID=A0A5B2X175_9PSEU|nr:STM4015 family protein [Solihabitans fulvus]KAA2256317.1 leucine-rich repeat domain-containing protein [Solihabitans fulvus]